VLKTVSGSSPVERSSCIRVIAEDKSDYLSCWAPSGINRHIGRADKVVSYVTKISYLDWNHSPRTATWKGDVFSIGDGVQPVVAPLLQYLDWDGHKQTAAWDAAANQFVVTPQ
jgi:hypothetical protein